MNSHLTTNLPLWKDPSGIFFREQIKNPTNADTEQSTNINGKRGRPHGKRGRSPLLSNRFEAMIWVMWQ